MAQHRKASSLLEERERRGVAAVELAFVLPLLCALVIGMIEMGGAMMVETQLCNAARKGCAMGIRSGKSNQDVTNEVKDILGDNGFDSTKFNPPTIGSVTITATDPNGAAVADVLTAPTDSTISVQVSIPVSSTMWSLSYFLKPGSSQVETVVMKKQ
jgi:Flp pilus assembly protein TadG